MQSDHTSVAQYENVSEGINIDLTRWKQTLSKEK